MMRLKVVIEEDEEVGGMSLAVRAFQDVSHREIR